MDIKYYIEKTIDPEFPVAMVLTEAVIERDGITYRFRTPSAGYNDDRYDDGGLTPFRHEISRDEYIRLVGHDVTEGSPYKKVFKELTKAELQIIPATPYRNSTVKAILRALDFASKGAGKLVGLFSLKAPSERIASLVIAIKTGVASSRIKTGRVSHDEFIKISDCMAEINSLPLYIDDTPSLTVAALRDKAKKLSTQGNLGIVIIDDLQSMLGFSGDKTIKELKVLAKELDIPILAFYGEGKND